MKYLGLCMINTGSKLNLSGVCLDFIFEGCGVEFGMLGKTGHIGSFVELGRSCKTT